MARWSPPTPDLPLRQAAFARARQLAQDYANLVPLGRIREGFTFGGPCELRLFPTSTSFVGLALVETRHEAE